MDGNRQDAYDLFLQYDVDGKKSYPLMDNRPIQIKALPAVLVLGFAMLMAAVIVPEGMRWKAGHDRGDGCIDNHIY